MDVDFDSSMLDLITQWLKFSDLADNVTMHEFDLAVHLLSNFKAPGIIGIIVKALKAFSSVPSHALF